MAIILINSFSLVAQSFDFQEALTIERKIMNAETSAEKSFFLWQKFHFFKQNTAFEQALETLNRIDVEEKDTIKQCDFFYQKALVQVALGNYSGAMSNVNEYCFYCSILDEEKQILRLLVLLENENWDVLNGLINRDSVSSSKPVLPHPIQLDNKKYIRSSAYLPGLGLLRLGQFRKGFSSLGLCIGALGFTTYNIVTGFYFTSVFSGINPFLKFYKGGKLLTDTMVEEENIKKANLVKQVGYEWIRDRYF